MVNVVTIAVIDDGIADHFFQEQCVLCMKVDALGRITRDQTEAAVPTHGTLCAGIIRRYMPDCRLISIRILSEKTRKGTLQQLLAALDWCTRKKIRLCNLSLGTSYWKDYFPLKRAVYKMVRQGQILVAAMGNDGQMLMPADLHGVIRVKEDLHMQGYSLRCCTGRFRQPDFYASSSHFLELDDAKGYTLVNGNSYATAVVTAAIAQMMKEMPGAGRNQIMNQMRKRYGR